MYFAEESIKNLLTCPLCENPFEDPRLLPCGETSCYNCIEKLFNNDGLESNANYVTNDITYVLKSIQNKRIEQLLKVKSCQVSRGKA